MDDILPPAGTKVPTVPPRNPRAKSARDRLFAAGFDPIMELVKTHKKLGDEIEIQEGIRSGELVLLRADNQKPRAYSGENHMRALEGQAKIATSLAEYTDKKAHQEVDNDKPAIPFVINVNTKK